MSRGVKAGGGGALDGNLSPGLQQLRPRQSLQGTSLDSRESEQAPTLDSRESEQAPSNQRINSVGKMIKRIRASGYEECMRLIAEHVDSEQQLYVTFLGTKSPTGKNWCPDCVIGEDLIEKCLDKIERDVIMLYVDVGDRVSWKSLDNIWRKDKVLRLSNVPTIIEWKRKLRLEGEQCLHLDMIQMYFDSE